jgi:hypothetical protein
MDYITSTQHAANPQTTSMLTQLTPALHDSGVEQALQEPLAAWILSRELYRQALSLGFQDTFLIAGIAVLAAIIPSFMLRHIKR